MKNTWFSTERWALGLTPALTSKSCYLGIWGEKVLLGEVAFLREKKQKSNKKGIYQDISKILKWGVEFFRIKEEIKGEMLSSVLIQEHLLSTAQTRGRCPYNMTCQEVFPSSPQIFLPLPSSAFKSQKDFLLLESREPWKNQKIQPNWSFVSWCVWVYQILPQRYWFDRRDIWGQRGLEAFILLQQTFWVPTMC